MKTTYNLIATILFSLGFSVAAGQTAKNISINKIHGASFSIEKNANGAVISWQTAAESNTSHFEVEISYDNTSFESIRTVAASDITHWNTSYEAKFKRTFLSAEKIYYRIKTVFTDGSQLSTESVLLEVKNAGGVSYASIH